MLICQSIVTGTYISIGVVVYYYCGSYVASPALGSAGSTMKKVCYGFALPGLIVTAMIVTHVSCQSLLFFILLTQACRSLPSTFSLESCADRSI